MNYYICKHVSVKYLEKHEFDPTFYPVNEWFDERKISYSCKPMIWKNKWIRTVFILPKDAAIENSVTHPKVKEYCLNEKGSYLKTDEGYVTQQFEKEQQKMFFVRSNTYYNEIQISYNPQLNGIMSKVIGFNSHKLDIFENPGGREEYNGWNFTDNRMWDALNNESFWYDHENERFVTTSIFEIGRQRSDQAVIPIIPQEYVFIARKMEIFFFKYSNVIK